MSLAFFSAVDGDAKIAKRSKIGLASINHFQVDDILVNNSSGPEDQHCIESCRQSIENVLH